MILWLRGGGGGGAFRGNSHDRDAATASRHQSCDSPGEVSDKEIPGLMAHRRRLLNLAVTGTKRLVGWITAVRIA